MGSYWPHRTHWYSGFCLRKGLSSSGTSEKTEVYAIMSVLAATDLISAGYTVPAL
jgi:hypothetical protein